MYLTEEKLLQWSTQESTDLSSNAYHFIKEHLFELPFVVAHHNDFEAFLQGSYANATNIKRDSDVDIVLLYNGIFRYDDKALSDDSKRARNSYYSRAAMSFKQCKDTIYVQLRNLLSQHSRVKNVIYNAKSIKIILQTPNIEVDVVPCFLYKKYRSFSLQNPDSESHYTAGIAFDNTDNGDVIVNYPKQHIENGQKKNKLANGQYKVTIRFIKKIKSLSVDKQIIDEQLASSYFIENLLYNVPNNYFESSCIKTFDNVLSYLAKSDLNAFKCQHEQWKLFGNNSTQWDLRKAEIFIQFLKKVRDGNYI